MNKHIKQTLLVTTSAIILGNIVYFSDSKLSAPEKVNFKNDHIVYIQQGINNYKTPTKYYAEADFFQLSDQIENCARETYITANERDELLEQLVGKYVNWFTPYAESKFKDDIWLDEDHQWMKQRITALRSLRIQSGTKKLIEGPYNRRFTSILDIINKYNAAWEHTRNIIFFSSNESRSILSKANQLASDSHLKNCKSLVDELHGMSDKLNTGHFQWLEQQVSKLNGYKYYKETAYNNLYSSIQNSIKDYNTTAFSIYGRNISTNYLATSAKQKYERGKKYFEARKSRVITYPDYRKGDKNRKLIVRSVSLFEKFTKVELGFIAFPGDEIKLSRATYLRVGGSNKKYFLTDAVNIPYAPKCKKFHQSNMDYQITLYFEPVPLNAEYINLIEEFVEGKGWEFRDIQVR